MNHRKDAHRDNVRVCRYLSENTCKFGDNCWYFHSPTTNYILTQAKGQLIFPRPNPKNKGNNRKVVCQSKKYGNEDKSKPNV